MNNQYQHIAKKPNFANQNWLYNTQQPIQRHYTSTIPRLVKESSTLKKQPTFSQPKTTKSIHSNQTKSHKEQQKLQQETERKQREEFTQLFEEYVEKKKQRENEKERKMKEREEYRKQYIPKQEKMKKEIEQITKQIENEMKQLEMNERKLSKRKGENEELEKELFQAKRSYDELYSLLENDLNVNEQLKLQFDLMIEREKMLKMDYNELITTIDQTEKHIVQSEDERRKLHNEVMELKGNVRVFCRIRPPLKTNGVSIEVSEDQQVIVHSTNYRGQQDTKKFSFDKTFGMYATQDEVFSEISQLVQSSLDGYQTCIFAYGQTGSGKTYTMEGTHEQPGMIPLTVHKIFSTIENLKTMGWTFTIQMKYVEIYNNHIFDLLHEKSEQPPRLEIKYENKLVVLKNANVKSIQTVEDVDHYIKIATKNRSVAETKCNAQSSRSHSLFMMDLHSTNTSTNEQRFGGLTLVDLAGSERLSESEAKGERKKETQNINTSLMTLGKVISAIAKKESHVPYRDSKLTELLQNCLGNQSKMLMFVNVSSDQNDTIETLSSLNFAHTVNGCYIGKAKKYVK